MNTALASKDSDFSLGHRVNAKAPFQKPMQVVSPLLSGSWAYRVAVSGLP